MKDQFIINNDTTIVKLLDMTADTITIPREITKIGKAAFLGATIKEVLFDDGSTLKEIEDHAFYGCSEIEKLHLPSTIERIGEYAFHGCEKLSSVDFEGSLTFIGKYAFDRTSLMKENKGLIAVGNIAVAYTGAQEEIVFPNDISIVADEFLVLYCASVKRVYFNNIRHIGKRAFFYCHNLEKISIPKVESIDDNAFLGSINEIIVDDGNNVKILGEAVFDSIDVRGKNTSPLLLMTDCYEIRNNEGRYSIKVHKSGIDLAMFAEYPKGTVIELGNYNFKNIHALDGKGIILQCPIAGSAHCAASSYDIPIRGTLRIPENAEDILFHSDFGFNDLFLHGNMDLVKEILIDREILADDRADKDFTYKSLLSFYSRYCENTERYIIKCKEEKEYFVDPAGALYKMVSDEGCNHIELVHYPIGRKEKDYQVLDGTKDIHNAFYKAVFLKRVILPNSVTCIGAEAFHYSGLREINIPSGIECIGNGSFEYGMITNPFAYTSIKKILLDSDNKDLFVDDNMNMLFSSRGSLITYIPGGRSIINLPEYCDDVSMHAFSGLAEGVKIMYKGKDITKDIEFGKNLPLSYYYDVPYFRCGIRMEEEDI